MPTDEMGHPPMTADAPPPLTSGEIEDLERLLEKATPGPWRVTTHSRRTRFHLRIVGNGHIAYVLTRDAMRPNADLIVSAINALPRLLSSLKGSAGKGNTSAAGAGSFDAPIPMVLWCPKCGEQHVDAPQGDWTNPPHRSHLCHACGCIWRPADVPTTGVAAITTRGSADTWLSVVNRARTPPSTAGWLPISTAPKDGSLFLAACPYLYKQTEERWDVHAIRIDENYDPPQLDDDCYQGWDLDAYTHWQPLPAPPAPSQEGDSEGEGQT